jgi:hypothetical protein
MGGWSFLRRSPPPKSADVPAFLCDRYWLKREKLAGCDDVFRALRIAGDDCFDFMQEFAENFGIDLGSYDWSKYHWSEGEEMDILWPIRRLLGWRSVNGHDMRRPLTPISVAHLEMVVRRQRWFDPAPP